MTKILVGTFLIAHGLVQASIWAGPEPKGSDAPPFDAHRSWLLDSIGVSAPTAKTLGATLAILTGIGFVAAGISLFADFDLWRSIAVISAMLSLPLMLLYFNPWLIGGTAIELAILYMLLYASWPAESVVGA